MRTVLIVAVGLYFLPWIVANRRGHHQLDSVVVLNLFGGWTVIAWIAALIWACSAVDESLKPKALSEKVERS